MTMLLQLLGAYWLNGGVFDLVECVLGHGSRSRLLMLVSAAAGAIQVYRGLGRDAKRSWRSTALGLVYVLLGVIVVANLYVTQAVIMLLLSTWAVVVGGLALFASFSLRLAQMAI